MRSKTGSRFTFWLGVGITLRLAMLALNAGGQGQGIGQMTDAGNGRFRGSNQHTLPCRVAGYPHRTASGNVSK